MPTIYFIIGVSGCGKTTIGKHLAAQLNVPFHDADDFHSEANIHKMSQAIPLTDDDRSAWLMNLHESAKMNINNRQSVVYACSALKEKYRKTLSQNIEKHINWVYLKGDFDTILERINQRKNHFMSPSLLHSQFDTLEEPIYGQHISITNSPSKIIKLIMNKNVELAQFGLVGLGVMGKSLARNFARNGVKMALFNRFVAGSEEQVGERFVAEFPELQEAQGFEDLAAFVVALERPRKILLMIKAGKETDEFIEKIIPFLAEGDILIDGGNSYFKDTKRRIEYLRSKKLNFIGTGVSGGEQGALWGPAIMPSGDAKVYKQLEKYLNVIAAKDKNGKPCCAYIGTEGAGHFIKMIHNGIEYAEMQLIAETYAHLRYINGLAPNEISTIFAAWNNTNLKSYLLEITSKILLKKEGEAWLIDQILDKAGNKGTGNWASITASELGMPATMITAALFARYVSTIKENYVLQNSGRVIYNSGRVQNPPRVSENVLKNAYQLARLLNHQQGFALMQAASDDNNWKLNFKEITRIWTNGCIIRSAMMEELSRIFAKHSDLLQAEKVQKQLKKGKNDLKKVCISSIKYDLASPCHQAALEYLNALESQFPTANIIQAQRDFFGAHTYQKVNDSSAKHYHTEWE